MSDDLFNGLVKLGHTHPELKPHLREILSSLEKQGATLNPDEMFGELRSAISRTDVDKMRSVLSQAYVYHRAYYKEKMAPYVYGMLQKTVLNCQKGDRLTLHYLNANKGSAVEVVVTQSRRDVLDMSGSKNTYLFVKKNRGRKEGTIDSYGDDWLYQATMNTQTERLVWIEKG